MRSESMVCVSGSGWILQTDYESEPAEIVNLAESGKWCIKGGVLALVQKAYTEQTRILAEQVETSALHRAKLERIARAVEYPKTTKRYLVDNHAAHMASVRAAIKEIERYYKKVCESFQNLELQKHRDAFQRDYVAPIKERLDCAEEVKDMLNALILDLKDNMNN